MNIRDRFNAQQEAFETALAASKESETSLDSVDILDALSLPSKELEEESTEEEVLAEEEELITSDEEEELISPLSIKIEDDQINDLDSIDPLPFTAKRTNRYKTLLHSDVLISLEQHLQASKTVYDRKSIWTTHKGAVMVAEYHLTETNPCTTIFIRNSYNGAHALGMIVGIEGENMYVFNDYKAIHRRHTKNIDLNSLMAIAVGEITTEYSKGMNLLKVMANLVVHQQYDHVNLDRLTQRDVIWHAFVDKKALPITLLPRAVEEYNSLITAKQEVSLLTMYQLLAKHIKKTNTRDRVVLQHRELMSAMLQSINSKRKDIENEE